MTSTNLPAYNLYRYLCSSEHAYVFEKRTGTAAIPTVCKNDGAPISQVSVYKQIPKLNGPLLQSNGTTISEVSPNYINFNSKFFTTSDTGSSVSSIIIKSDDAVTSSDNIWSSQGTSSYISTQISSATSSINQIKVTANDTTPSYLSSSVIGSNNLSFTVVNPGADEKYQAAVITSDGVSGSNVLWSANYIASHVSSSITAATTTINQPKVTVNDTTPSYLSSSVIGSNNISFTVVNPGGDEKYQAAVITSDGVSGSNVLWSANYIASYVSTYTSSSVATKYAADLYQTTTVASSNASFIDMTNLTSRYIDTTGYNLSGDNKTLRIYNPGIYKIIGKLNASVPTGTSTFFDVSTRFVMSTDATNFNAFAISNQTTVNVARSTTVSNSYSIVSPFIHQFTQSDTYIRFQLRTNNASNVVNTIPSMCGFTVNKL